MSTYRLRLHVWPWQLKWLTTSDFLWLPPGERSSIDTTLSPRLEEFGDVPELHVDLVRLAVLVYLADRSAPRETGPGVRWDRDLELSIPVSAPAAWNDVSEELADLLHVLSGDRWRLGFEQARPARRGEVAEVDPAQAVCLFSGGADSLAGALSAHAATAKAPVLVSHWDSNGTSSVQTALVGELAKLWGAEPDHHSVQLRRRSHQVRTNDEFPDEKSRRTRSFLFLSLGLAVAAVRGAELWMSENGFTTINPPLSPERRGSLTTRTTNPAFLDGLVVTLRSIGLKADLRNPLEFLTKGEVLVDGAQRVPAGQADALFSMTHSCGKTPWFKGFAQHAQCGLCFGCLVRRGSFVASGLRDSTEYIEEALRGTQRWNDFVTPGRRKTVEAVRYRLDREFAVSDLLALGLPSRLQIPDALDLVNRGLAELRPVVDSIP
jgi:7-cyano-7-deazaguanine synthase in queuosine biosynthesis